MRRFFIPAFAIVVFMAPPFVHAAVWEIDSAHSSAQFAVRHLMVSTVRGAFGAVSGTVNINEADITQSSVEATIDASSIDTRQEKRDEHLRGADFFDVEKYPTITFTSTKIEKVEDGKYKVTGNLTMHGVTKEVVLDVEGSPTPIKDPMGNMKMGGVATTQVNRKDFGLTYNAPLDAGGVLIGEEVKITIDLELSQKKEG